MSAIDRARLAKLLGMLGSAYPGEIVAAARQVERLRKAANLTWPEILAVPAPRVAYAHVPAEAGRSEPGNLRAILEYLLQDARISDWERTFLRSLLQRRAGKLSTKQTQVLDRIRDKCRYPRAA